MNIEQAKSVPLALLLERLGYKPAKDQRHQSFYLSPLRLERTASFHVHHQKNIWYDFGTGKGGSAIDFVCAYLESTRESSSIKDALRWIHIMSGQAPAIQPIAFSPPLAKVPKLVLKSVKSLSHPALLRYLQSRGITMATAGTCMAEAHLFNSESKKNFFAIAFKNEESGYELRNPFFKSVVGKKAISFVRGTTPKPDGLHIFEGFMDYASAITQQPEKNFEDDALILNSLSLLKYATPYIKGYGYKHAYTWLDNDTAGEKATASLAAFFKTEEGLCHLPMNKRYQPHKDVNEWHMALMAPSVSPMPFKTLAPYPR